MLGVQVTGKPEVVSAADEDEDISEAATCTAEGATEVVTESDASDDGLGWREGLSNEMGELQNQLCSLTLKQASCTIHTVCIQTINTHKG